MMIETDEYLVRAYVAGGCLSLLDKLIDRHLVKVRNLICSMVLNASDADDLTQETFIKATAALPGFRHNACFKTWLYRIAVNTVRSFMRRRGAMLVDFTGEMHESAVTASVTPSSEVISREEWARLMRAITSLSPCLRRAFILVGVHEFNPREAARIEGCLTATMYRRVHVARRQLQKMLREEVAS
ncbi:MAG: RNA polymerase sigma factor [Kiritimatiellia bacterium]|nr:RNA polymerase sigma factor [Lentisphaerota bacterium]